MNNETRICPYCCEEIPVEATKCKYCKSMVGGIVKYENKGCRDQPGRLLGGVAAYLARTMGISVTIVRLAFIIGTIVAAPFALGIYAVVWLVIPFREGDATPMDGLLAEGRRLWERYKTGREYKKAAKTKEVIIETTVSGTD